MTDFPDPPLPAGLISKNVVDLPVPARAAADQWWAAYEKILDHWLDLYRQHRVDCDEPAWCTDHLLDVHIDSAEPNDLQALIYVALSRLVAQA